MAESRQTREPDKPVFSREQEIKPEGNPHNATNDTLPKTTPIATNIREHANRRESVYASTRTREQANTLGLNDYRKIAGQKGYSLFQDQEEFLRSHTLLEKLKGKSVSASQIIRDALDVYIEGLKKKQATSVR